MYWSEGPVWLESQQTLLWSDISNNRIVSWNEKDGMTVWREPSNFTNGHYLDLTRQSASLQPWRTRL